MNTSPAFQFYPGDWLSSPKITMMSPAEEGAYIRLLSYAWADPDCTIPDDDQILAALSRLGDAWKNSMGILRQCFTTHPRKPGRLFNARLLEERKKQHAWRLKCSKGGKESAKQRAEEYLKVSSRVVQARAVQVNPNSLSSSSSPPSSSSSPSKKEKTEKRDAAVLPAHKMPHSVSDEEWLKQINANPAFQHIDVDHELSKMDAWLSLPKNKGRKKTRSFALNWLSKIEKPMADSKKTSINDKDFKKGVW